jgi:hypothetical protein
MAVKSIHLGGHAPEVSTPAEASAATLPPVGRTFVPLSEEQLAEVQQHADLVLDLGVAGAPGAAHAVAELAAHIVVELHAARRSGPPSVQAVDAAIWRDRALRAEKRCTALGLAGEDLLRDLANERGTREGLEAAHARDANEIAAAHERLGGLEAQIAPLAQVLLDEFDGPTRSESACEMAVRVLREQRARIADLEAACRETQTRGEALIAQLRGAPETPA